MKILVIDDEAQVRTVLQRFLKICGFEVDCAADGMEGLEKAQSFIPDCIILDINMPNMNGLSLYSVLRGDVKTSRIPVLFLTGAAMGSLEDAIKEGANGYLSKPFDFNQLKKKLESVLGKRA